MTLLDLIVYVVAGGLALCVGVFVLGVIINVCKFIGYVVLLAVGWPLLLVLWPVKVWLERRERERLYTMMAAVVEDKPEMKDITLRVRRIR
jgi:hypothetical protein